MPALRKVRYEAIPNAAPATRRRREEATCNRETIATERPPEMNISITSTALRRQRLLLLGFSHFFIYIDFNKKQSASQAAQSLDTKSQ
jgi:hypothetical protein